MPETKRKGKRKHEELTDQLANPNEAIDQNELPEEELDESSPKRIKVNGYDVNVFPEDDEDVMRQAAAAYTASKARSFNPTADGLKKLGYKGKRPEGMRYRIEQLRKEVIGLLRQVDDQIAALTAMQIKLDEASVDAVKEFLDATCDCLAILNVAMEQLINDISTLTANKNLPEPVKQILQNLMDQITTTPLENSINNFVSYIPEENRPPISELSPYSQQLLPRIVPEIYSLPRPVMVR